MPPMCAGVRHETHGSSDDAPSAADDASSAACIAARLSSTSLGTPAVPEVAITRPIVSSTRSPTKIVTSSPITMEGRARSSRARRSEDDSR